MEKTKKTKSYSYILPMLHDVYRMKMSLSQLSNVYIEDEEYPFLNSHIFLLYEFTADTWFLDFEEDVKESENWELTKDKDKFHVMMVFKVPEKYKEDYKMFKDSKYSKMSSEYKEIIKQFHGLHKDHPIVDVLYKNERAFNNLESKLNVKIPRTQEASSLLDIKGETYLNSMKKKDSMRANWDLKV